MIPRLLGRAGGHLRRRETVALLGATALALAVGVAFLPGLFPASVFRPLSRLVASQTLVVLFGLVAGLLAVLSVRVRVADADGEREPWVPDAVPERAHYDDHRTAGSDVDDVLEADPEDRPGRDARVDARGRIRETAVRAVAAAENCDPESAAERVADGTWTDDPRAAAFLGGPRHAPLRVRIRDWASGERFERWATRAVEEVEALADGEGRR